MHGDSGLEAFLAREGQDEEDLRQKPILGVLLVGSLDFNFLGFYVNYNK